MNYKQDIQPISYFKTNAASLFEHINQTKRPVVITQNGKARGVFIDTESFEAMQRAISLLKLISQSEEDVRKGNTQNQNQVFKQVKSKFNNAA